MSDLISRQAILKNIEKIRQGVQMMDDTHRADIIMNGMYLCEKAVMNQPSEQPEIIRCRECKWYELPSHKITENCVRWMKSNGILLPIKPNDYCSYGERREE